MAPEPFRDHDMQATLLRVELLSRLLDSAFVIPGTRIRFGIDAAIGVIPIVGDIFSQLISSYIIWEAKRLGVSRLTLWRMMANSGLDLVLGSVPLVGDAFDVAFRANLMNLALLKAHLAKHGHTVRGQAAGAGQVIDVSSRRID